MSRERLQEHFSELFEGTIDPGLAQQINTRFEGDYDLQADYKGFVDTMSLLETMKDETIETPPNLSSMIADRLEANAKKPAMSINTLWRNLGLGALACVAIGGAFFAINNKTTSGPGEAGTGFPGGPRIQAPRKVLDTFEVKMSKDKPYLTYESSGVKTVVVSNQEDKSLLKRFNLGNSNSNTMNCPLENQSETPSVIEVEASGDTAKHFIVLPGTGIDYEAVGHGDLLTFAKLLATKYRTVIHIQVTKENTGDFKWDVSQSAGVNDAAKAVLSPTEYNITGDPSVLVIQKQNH